MTDLEAEAAFFCSLCGKEAGHIALIRRDDGVHCVRRSFTSTLSGGPPLTGEAPARLRAAVERADAAELHRFDFELAPFYCPDCDSSYCGDHWTRVDMFDDEGFHDSIRGICPNRHQRMLED